MSDGQHMSENDPMNLGNPYGIPTADNFPPMSAPVLQEVQKDSDEPSVREMVIGILNNQTQILNNQAIIDGKLNSIGAILDYMGQTVQGVTQQFAGGKGLQNLMGMLGGGKQND